MQTNIQTKNSSSGVRATIGYWLSAIAAAEDYDPERVTRHRIATLEKRLVDLENTRPTNAD